NREVGGELARPFVGFLKIHSEDEQTPALVPVISGDQVGRLLPAGQTPAGPEIYEQRLALKVAQAQRLTGECLEEKVGRGPADLGRRRLPCPILVRRQINSAETGIARRSGRARLKEDKAADDRGEDGKGEDDAAKPAGPFPAALRPLCQFVRFFHFS